ncbi:MAG: hypothetical protein ACRDMV_12455, partial [Streptosporangiales bacterium]
VAQAASGWPADATWTVQRSVDLVTWQTVRGGLDVPVDAGALPVDDYEFAAGEVQHYRVQVFSDGTLLGSYTDQVVVGADELWLKFVPYAFLNMTVHGSSSGDVTRAARAGLFSVLGRSKPVAVTDTRGSRTYELVVDTETGVDRDQLDAALASGDVVFLQVPSGYQIPGGWYSVGDTTEARKDIPWDRRWWTLPLTEVAAPGPDVVPVTFTWRAVRNRWATWADLRADVESWRELRGMVADPGDAVVP